jgi:riboflavin biosynthesis pyrimidine reductase
VLPPEVPARADADVADDIANEPADVAEADAEVLADVASDGSLPTVADGSLPAGAPPLALVQRLEALDDDDLADLYDYPHELDRAYVRANFITSLDGAVTGADGLSGSIGNPADRRVFALLRALSDVILVGAGTARVEGYQPVRVGSAWRGLRERLGLAPAPVLAVVTASLELPPTVLDPLEGSGPLLVVTCGGADPERVAAARDQLGEDAVVQVGRDRIDVAEAVEQLGARGLRRVLLEGGPRLMSDVVGCGLLDELCLTLSPMIVGGDAPRVVGGAPVAQGMRLAHLLESQGVLLTRWTRG